MRAFRIAVGAKVTADRPNARKRRSPIFRWKAVLMSRKPGAGMDTIPDVQTFDDTMVGPRATTGKADEGAAKAG